MLRIIKMVNLIIILIIIFIRKIIILILIINQIAMEISNKLIINNNI